jgi:MEMO1 family protein
MNDLPEFPKLRAGLAAAADATDQRFVYLFDQLRLGGRPVRLSRQEFGWARLFNGERSLRDIQTEATLLGGGLLVALQEVKALVARLDGSFFLDSPHLHEYLLGPEREPACIGCYPPEPELMRRHLRRLFTAPGGPGMPGGPGCRVNSEGRLRAALLPHVDYTRGGITYGWGFHELVERSDAEVFVIIGTSHYSAHRFTLTRKNFKSPLGTVLTDQAFIDKLVAHYGDGLFDDPLAHLPEHSIELEVVLLQFLYEGKRPFRIVPMVVGPFSDCVDGNTDPTAQADIQRMIAALRKAEEETNAPVCYLISGDLAHLGPKFGDAEPVGEPLLERSQKQDEALLDRAAAADAAGYFRLVAEEGDSRRICGLPPTFTVLEAAQPRRGRVLHHSRYVHPQGFESVSFASMAFDA